MKLLKILLEQEKTLVPRRSREERAKNYLITINKKIQQYIKDGSIGSLELGETKITSLPDNLKSVGGNLDLYGTPITSLPDNLKSVGESVILSYSAIKSLPDNLEIGRNLYLDDTPIKSLPNNLEVKGSLDLTYTSITSLPDNLKVRGSLAISGIPLAEKYTDEEIRNLAYIGGEIYR